MAYGTSRKEFFVIDVNTGEILFEAVKWPEVWEWIVGHRCIYVYKETLFENYGFRDNDPKSIYVITPEARRA